MMFLRQKRRDCGLLNETLGGTTSETNDPADACVGHDVLDMMNVMAHARISGIISLGGGTPKSFIQQAAVSSFLAKEHHHGHKYAIQISTDAPHPGGRSNAVSFDEGLVYGKLARGAPTAYVPCDATIALPILITSLSQTAAKYMKGRKRPNFTFGRELIVEVP